MGQNSTLLRIEINPTKPNISTTSTDMQTIGLLHEYSEREQWDKVKSLCVNRVNRCIANFPNPELDGGDIAFLYFASTAYNATGDNDRSAACLKALYSFEPFQSHLPDQFQVFVSEGAEEYTALSEKVGTDFLNNLQIKDVFKASAASESKSGGCFIATACYGSYDAQEVLVLRQFRDEVLLKSQAGRAFVKCYYTMSPPIAQFIQSREKLKMWVRCFLINKLVKIVGNNQ